MTSSWSFQRRSFTLPVLLLSLAILTQELLLVRLLAVGMWHHITYMVVTMALLAFGFAGTLLAVFPGLAGGKDSDGSLPFAIHSLLFSATTFLSGYAISTANIDTQSVFNENTRLWHLVGGVGWELLKLYLLVGLPILFGGLAVATALRQARGRLAGTYFANLLGSALGCAVFLLLLTPLGGRNLLLLTSALGAVAALKAHTRAITLLPAACILGLGFSCIAFQVVREMVVPSIEPKVTSKVFREYIDQHGHQREGKPIWDPLCRVEVTSDPQVPNGRKVVFQDGDAPTFIEPADFNRGAETMVPYQVHPDLKNICIIGAGGGRELQLATERGVERAVGVEINSATVSLLRGPYKAFTGNLVDHENVELVNDEGRAFLARSKEKFDYIQMTGVDTYAALNSGAYVNSESYLYTKNAFHEYLDHLNPGGYFSIIRYFFANQPRETLRLFVTAIEVLKERGIEEPWKHVMVIGPVTNIWGILIVSESPFEETTVTRVTSLVDGLRQGGSRIDIVHSPLGEQRTKNPFVHYTDGLKKGESSAALVAAYALNVEPVTDDSPFLYLYWHWGEQLRNLLGMGEEVSGSPTDAGMANMGGIPAGAMVLLSLLIQCTLVGLLLVIGPLVLFKARALAVPGRLRVITYFTCLGLGFMLLEIALAQRFALFLGHPTLSLSVVIGGMLFFSGLGCAISGLFPARRMALLGTFVAALAVVGILTFLPSITQEWLREKEMVRILMALGVIAPLAIFLGMPMACGLRILEKQGPDLIPWAFGVNGVASVVGSILAILLAQTMGFGGVLITSGVLYLLAFATCPRTA